MLRPVNFVFGNLWDLIQSISAGRDEALTKKTKKAVRGVTGLAPGFATNPPTGSLIKDDVWERRGGLADPPGSD
jgi:hypothetical protein